MDNKITNWSQLRFSVIGGLLARPPEPGKLDEEIKRLASRCYPSLWEFSSPRSLKQVPCLPRAAVQRPQPFFQLSCYFIVIILCYATHLTFAREKPKQSISS